MRIAAWLISLGAVGLLTLPGVATPASQRQTTTRYWNAIKTPLMNAFMTLRMSPEALQAAGVDTPAKVLLQFKRAKQWADQAKLLSKGTPKVPLPAGWGDVGTEFSTATGLLSNQCGAIIDATNAGRNYDAGAAQRQFDLADTHLRTGLAKLRIRYAAAGSKFEQMDDVMIHALQGK